MLVGSSFPANAATWTAIRLWPSEGMIEDTAHDRMLLLSPQQDLGQASPCALEIAWIRMPQQSLHSDPRTANEQQARGARSFSWQRNQIFIIEQLLIPMADGLVRSGDACL